MTSERLSRRQFIKSTGQSAVSVWLSGRFGGLAEIPATPLDKKTYEQIMKELEGAKIFMIVHSHNDYAWTMTRDFAESRIVAIFEDVLKLMNEYPEFKFYFDVEHEIYSPLVRRIPHRISEIKQRVAQKRLAIAGGTACHPTPHRIGGETFIRNMVLGRRYFEREFPGVDLSVMTFNDTIVGYSQLPQLIRKGGYRYHRFFRPLEALDEKGVPRQFFWEGLDGSRLLCSRGSYGGLWWLNCIPEDYRENWPATVQALYYGGNYRDAELSYLLTLSPTKVIYFPQGNDESRPLRVLYRGGEVANLEKPEPFIDIPGMLREWNKREKVPFHFATPHEYFAELERHADQIPTVSGILDPVGWSQWYFGGSKGLCPLRIRGDQDLTTAEKILSVASLFGHPYPQEELDQLWHDLLTICPHATDWLIEDEQQTLWHRGDRVCRRAQEMIRGACSDLRQQVSVHPSEQSYLVFNSLSWSRQDVATIHCTYGVPGTRGLTVRNDRGESLLFQMGRYLLHSDGSLKEFDLEVITEVPEFGYSVIHVESSATPFAVPRGSELLVTAYDEAAQGENARTHFAPAPAVGGRGTFIEGEVETANYRARLGTRGLEELQDKVSGVRYSSWNQIRYQRFKKYTTSFWGPESQIEPLKVAGTEVLETGELYTLLRIIGTIGPHQIEQRIRLFESIPRIDFVTTIEAKPDDGVFRAYFQFPFNGQLNAEVPFGVESRDLSKEPYGREGGKWEREEPNVFYADGWVDYSNSSHGLSLFTAVGQRSLIFDPVEKSVGYILLKTVKTLPGGWYKYINHAFKGTGTHQFNYAVYPHAGDWKSSNTYRRSMEFHHPLITVPLYPSASPGQLPARHSFVGVAPDHVVISAFFREDKNWYLRLYETLGSKGPVNIALPFSPSQITETDFNGDSLGKEITQKGQRVAFEILPWEIVTLRLEGGR